MTDSDDISAEAPKRRGRRLKPASLSKPAAAEDSGDAEAKPAKRGRRGKAASEAPGDTSDRPAPVREEAPPPASFSTSDDDLHESPRRTEEPPQAEAPPPPSPEAAEGQSGPGPQGDGHQPRHGDQHPQQGYRGDRGYGHGGGGGGRPWDKPWKQQGKFNRDFKKNKFGKPYPPQGGGGYNPGHKPPPPQQFKPKVYGTPKRGTDIDVGSLQLGELPVWEPLRQIEEIDRMGAEATAAGGKPLDFNEIYVLTLNELEELAHQAGLTVPPVPTRRQLIRDLLKDHRTKEKPIKLTGLLDLLDNEHGVLAYAVDNYRLRGLSCFMPQRLIDHWGLRRGHEVEVWAHPPRDGESCPYALKVISVNGRPPEDVAHITPFTELTPYYPTDRFLLETAADAKWDNNSMRIVDLLTPVGLGQRGLIVAPPRTGKTVLMQGIASSIRQNRPEVPMIILLVDERPEEVTDFRRSVQGAEVISSTFDEPAESHVHAAEMVIEKARRMVEYGHHVVILLDSITRLARAYNTLMPSSGKILSGGVEASALQKPKRFFGSARNIEGGGSLTILGTALVETGSKMDEVIFEEFKGTGNMELHLDRALSDKRIFPALSFEKSGTRKEELLYHKDELQKIYSLRRAMKGIPSTEAMEMLITRVKKTKSNAEFLVSLNR
ncbi:MAG TPA: transcription termination factor Rho [Opitutales bacterium]|nr:transcription termination factor Rho [Opitutales bacterium]